MRIHRYWFLALAAAPAVFAQVPAEQGVRVERFSGPPPGVGVGGAAGPFGDVTFEFVAGEMSFDARLVKGAPYSAEATTETQQVLADGNRITRRNTSAIYRDSEGRTRREMTLGAIGPWASRGAPRQTVFINDPVAGVNYVLDPDGKTARKMAFRGRREGPPRGQISAAKAPPTDRPRPRVESLGKRLIEGVEAEGTRTTTTIAPGQIGNERPIEIVSERWFSQELKTVVMSRRSDPRMGETTFQLTNIRRSEPLRSMFEVPPEYTVREGPPSFEQRMGPPREPRQ